MILHVDGCNGRIEDWKNDEEKHFAGKPFTCGITRLGQKVHMKCQNDSGRFGQGGIEAQKNESSTILYTEIS